MSQFRCYSLPDDELRPIARIRRTAALQIASGLEDRIEKLPRVANVGFPFINQFKYQKSRVAISGFVATCLVCEIGFLDVAARILRLCPVAASLDRPNGKPDIPAGPKFDHLSRSARRWIVFSWAHPNDRTAFGCPSYATGIPTSTNSA